MFERKKISGNEREREKQGKKQIFFIYYFLIQNIDEIHRLVGKFSGENQRITLKERVE